MTFNDNLGYRTLAEIDRDLSRWGQGAWIAPILPSYEVRSEAPDQFRDDPVTVCGAKLCYAGHAAILAGWMLTRDALGEQTVVNPGTGETMQIMDAAALELGLGMNTCLFAGHNTREQLGAMVDVLASGGDEEDADNARREYPSADADYDDDDDPCGCELCLED